MSAPNFRVADPHAEPAPRMRVYPPEPPTPENPVMVASGQPKARTPWLRRLSGILAVAALVLILIATEGQASGNGADTVVQQIAYYAQGAFYAIVVTGITIALYVAGRADR